MALLYALPVEGEGGLRSAILQGWRWDTVVQFVPNLSFDHYFSHRLRLMHSELHATRRLILATHDRIGFVLVGVGRLRDLRWKVIRWILVLNHALYLLQGSRLQSARAWLDQILSRAILAPSFFEIRHECILLDHVIKRIFGSFDRLPEAFLLLHGSERTHNVATFLERRLLPGEVRKVEHLFQAGRTIEHSSWINRGLVGLNRTVALNRGLQEWIPVLYEIKCTALVLGLCWRPTMPSYHVLRRFLVPCFTLHHYLL